MRGEQNARLAAGPDLRSLEVKPTFQFSAAIVPMATSAPLLGKQGKAAHSKASIFYGADEYLEELRVPLYLFGLGFRGRLHDLDIVPFINLSPIKKNP